jgi:hypothetical protein
MNHLDEVLNEFVRDSTPTEGEMEKALRRAERWGQILLRDRDMCVDSFLPAGSCAKGTACRPIGDADVVVLLRPDAFPRADGGRRQPAGILDLFAERLRVTCRALVGVTVRSQTHSVRLVHDGQHSFDVDVVPAYPGPKGVVEIPERGTRDWIRTSFMRQAELLNEFDVRNRAVRRTIRLLKYWRDQQGLAGFPSYAIEVLVLLAASRGTPRHPFTLLQAALRLLSREREEALVLERYWRASSFLRPGVYDPAVPENNLTAQFYARDRLKIGSRAERAANALDRARLYLDGGSRSRADDRINAAFARD